MWRLSCCGSESWRGSTQARKAGYRHSFHVRVSGVEAQRTFLTLVGGFGPRFVGAAILADVCSRVEGNTNVDTLPAEVFATSGRPWLNAASPSARWPACVERRTGYLAFQFRAVTTTVLDYAELLDDERLRTAATSDLFWDPWWRSSRPATAKSSTSPSLDRPAGWPMASSVTTRAHLEQDADLVILIYRDDVYNKDPNNPDAGTAELILAKQRNGPTGSVKVAFLREQTRFASLAPGGA